MTYCSFCHKKINKQPTYLARYKHAFCDRECFFKYQKEVWVYPKTTFDRDTQKRLKEMANKYQKNKGGKTRKNVVWGFHKQL